MAPALCQDAAGRGDLGSVLAALGMDYLTLSSRSAGCQERDVEGGLADSARTMTIARVDASA